MSLEWVGVFGSVGESESPDFCRAELNETIPWFESRNAKAKKSRRKLDTVRPIFGSIGGCSLYFAKTIILKRRR